MLVSIGVFIYHYKLILMIRERISLKNVNQPLDGEPKVNSIQV